MPELLAVLLALAAIALLAALGWALSAAKRDVSIVDSLWPLFFLLGTLVYAALAGAAGPRSLLLLALVTFWALRLGGYLTWRNWGEPEDRRYQAIRARNEPGFAWKSLYLVFGLQALLAWVIAMPLFAGLSSAAPLSAIDYAGAALWILGFGFETIADWQLARFKADPASRGRVLDSGLWRYTRHPNYFGEAVLWWGLFLIALAAGGGWTVFAPILMTILLLKVSGVALLEKDIGERRPDYRDYIARTNAFIPGPPRASA
jgi:steroid 5-alpha reductase family enzyme